MMKKTVFCVLVSIYFSLITAHQHRIHNQRAPISFQAFDQSSGFPNQAPLRPVNIATQLTVNSGQHHRLPTHQHNVRAIAEAPGGNSAGLPLFKQSYPGVYVKGLASLANFKYEPTRQVSHHQGPDFQPRNVASSRQHDFAVNPFSSFN